VATDLADIQRVAARGAVHRVHECGVEVARAVLPHRGRDIGERQPADVNDEGAVLRLQAGEHGSDVRLLHTRRARRCDDPNTCNDREELLQHPNARMVRPLQVIHHDEQCAGTGKVADGGRDCGEEIGAWSFAPRPRFVVRREVMDHVAGEAGEAVIDPRCEAYGGERVDDHAIGRGRSFAARAVKDNAALVVCTHRGLARQSTLADSGRAEHRGKAGARIVGEQGVEPAQLCVASDDRRSARVEDRCRKRQ
jgi:hypothetical protein